MIATTNSAGTPVRTATDCSVPAWSLQNETPSLILRSVKKIFLYSYQALVFSAGLEIASRILCYRLAASINCCAQSGSTPATCAAAITCCTASWSL